MKSLDLNKIRNYFATKPVDKAWIFGSYARGEQTLDSDVDILVTYTPGERPGLFGIVDMIEDLQQILGIKVDLVERDRLYSRVAKEVELQKIPIYEIRS